MKCTTHRRDNCQVFACRQDRERRRTESSDEVGYIHYPFLDQQNPLLSSHVSPTEETRSTSNDAVSSSPESSPAANESSGTSYSSYDNSSTSSSDSSSSYSSDSGSSYSE